MTAYPYSNELIRGDTDKQCQQQLINLLFSVFARRKLERERKETIAQHFPLNGNPPLQLIKYSRLIGDILTERYRIKSLKNYQKNNMQVKPSNKKFIFTKHYKT